MTEKPTLLPVYLIIGEDELKRDHLLERMRVRIAEMGDADLNTDTFDATQALGNEIVTTCNTLPFLGDVRCVIVKNIDALKKADADMVAEYLSSPCETTVLVMVGVKLAKNTKLYKAVAKVSKTSILECVPKKRFELPKHIRDMAATHGVTISASAAELLVEMVGENTVHLDAELKKLAIAHQGKNPINEAEVRAIVSETAEVKPWDIANAYANRDLKTCIELIGRMESDSPYRIIGGCVDKIRELLIYHALQKRGQASSFASYLKVPAWRVKNHPQWARKWKPCELRHALSTSRDAERAMKTGAVPKEAFIDWMIESLSYRG